MRVCGDYGLHLTQNLSVGETGNLKLSMALSGTSDAIKRDNHFCIKYEACEWTENYQYMGATGCFTTFDVTPTGAPHNNVSPGIAVYAWHRTA